MTSTCKHEIFTTIDLEMAQPSGKIIQVGACTGSIKTGEIFETLRAYVKIDESLSEYICKLTGITDFQLITHGTTLHEAYLKLRAMHEKHQAHASLIQWGAGDEICLKTQLGIKPEEWVFGRRMFDVKTVYQSYCLANGMNLQGGLAKSMGKLGLKFQGSKHDACDDAINTFRIYVELLKRMRS